MDQLGIVLCEIAVEAVASAENANKNLEFVYGKKRWQLKPFLANDASTIIECINQCEEARTKKICFKALKRQKPAGEAEPVECTLVLLHQNTAFRTRAIELRIAATLFPKVFANYTPSLEFQVAEQQQQQQRVLKSYVTTQLFDALYKRHHQVIGCDIPPLALPACFKSKLRKYQERTVLWMLGRERQQSEFPANWTALTAVDGHSRVYKHNYCLEFYAFAGTQPTISLPPGGILADEMGLGKTVELLALVLLHPRSSVSNEYWHNLLLSLDTQLNAKAASVEHEVLCICTRKHLLKLKCRRCQLWQHEQCVRRRRDEYFGPPDDAKYICPNCWTELAAYELIESASTFIVSPNAIKMQWYHEISTHINPSLRVLLYPGVHSGSWLSPMELAQYDVVLTDYEILRSEIYHTADYKSDRKMRHQQRFMRPTSPLLMVNWWRVCLDEAQMVECSKTQAAEMVRKLPAINRWAVTGTPIQRSIDDLSPLLRFVGFNEACEPLDAWQTVSSSFLLNHKNDALLELLQRSMWRTCKSKVEHELGIPPQTEVVHRLDLSNVESLYYREEHFKCTEQFLSAVAKHARQSQQEQDNNSRLASISPQLLKLILKPFLRIRQTCSVPVVLTNNVATMGYLNPQDLLAHLKASNEVECKSQLRSWASSYNGIAAVCFIKKSYTKAVKYYKLALKLAQDYNEEHISVDSVLIIHALHNTLQANALVAASTSAERQLTGEELAHFQTQLTKLEWKYLEENTKVLQTARSAYETKLGELQQLQQEYSASIVELFATVITESTMHHDALWNRIRDEFFRQNIPAEKLQNVASASGMIYIIDMWCQRLAKLKDKLDKEFVYLTSAMQSSCGAVEKGDSLPAEVKNFFSSVSDCHLSDILEDNSEPKAKKEKKSRCRLCTTRDLINQFECLLFDKELEKEATVTEGMEKPSVELCLIKVVFTFLRMKPELSAWQTECEKKIETLDCMQSLCKLQIKHWIEIEYVVKAFDELEMCKMRISLTDDPKEISTHRVLACQLDELTRTQLINANEAQLNYTRLAGRLKYLKHLKEDTNDKPCPICTTLDDPRYVVLVCGHFICQTCLDHMKRATREHTTKCPICRQKSPQLYYSMRAATQKSLVGDFSIKIAYIVEQVLSLKAQDDQTKVLIFSQWQTILKHIAMALAKNFIEYRNKCTNRDIDEFKDRKRKITCLLMPLSRGSKGLNLIEATHVFLVEPILNPGEELQAIGRVHRFGQTKPTKVHRFIVNDTIEENIMTLIASADDEKTLSTHWDLENMTLESLKELFILKEQK